MNEGGPEPPPTVTFGGGSSFLKNLSLKGKTFNVGAIRSGSSKATPISHTAIVGHF